MYKTPRHCFIACLLLTPFLWTQAQPKYVSKYGNVSLQEIKMNHYAPDTSAQAVVLFDRGHLYANTGTFERHVRLKILKPAGTGFANFTVKTPSKASIDGTTFNFENGKVVESPITNENIFKEEVMDDFEIFKVFFPNVKPGSVVEFRYFFKGLPYEWRFQQMIPVMYSEIILEPSIYVTFKKTMYGMERVTEVDNMRWFSDNVPAFHGEPSMSHYSNYLTHFKFDIERLFYKEYSTSWDKIGYLLREYKYFGGVIENAPFLNQKASEIRKSEQPLLSKVNEAFRYIQENIKWNQWTTAFASKDYWANFTKNHSGNSAEINLLLTSLLIKCGIKAYPAILSTRDNGLLNPASASLNSIDYVIAYVSDGGLSLQLDATSPNLVPGILPVRCRNVSAFVIDKTNGWWIDTSKGKSSTRKQFINIKIEASGEVISEINNTHEDYDYLAWFDDFNKFGSEEDYVKSLITKTTDAEITECRLAIDKSKLSATEKIKVNLNGTEYINDLGSMLVINPFVFNDLDNPFKSESRRYPVDFVCLQNRTFYISIKIPEGYTFANIPPTFQIMPETGGAKFSFQAGVANGMLSIMCKLLIDRQIFSEQEYEPLQKFFVEVNRKFTESIKIAKKT